MNIICKIRGHKWKDGYCARCGREHTPHEFIPQPGICVEKCVICNMSKEVEHSFSQRGACEFVCTNCGKRITKHAFTRKSACTFVCTRCGVEKTEHTPEVKKGADGALYLVCAECGTMIKRLSPEEAAQFARHSAPKSE